MTIIIKGGNLAHHTLAQTLPGPVLFHSIAHGKPEALDAAYRFLFADDPGEAPRLDPGMFAYCQPALVDSQAPIVKPRSSHAIELNEALFDEQPVPGGAAGGVMLEMALPEKGVPNWLSAAQRHVEAVSLDIQRRKESASRAPTNATRRADVATATLDELQQIVANFARTTRRDDAS